MATRTEFEALMQQRIDEGDYEKANRIRVEKLGLPPIQPPPTPNTDPSLQVDSGFQEFGNVLSGLPQNAMTGLAEMGSATGRSMAQGLDFLGPGTVNAGLRLAGSDYQLPTAEGGYEGLSELAGSPTGGYMQEGTARDAIRGFGGAAPAALGMAPVFGRNVATPMGALADLVGLGSATPAANVAPLALDALTPPPATARIGDLVPQTAARSNLDTLVNEGSESVNRAGYRLNPYTGRAAADEGGRASMKQGVGDDFVSMVAAASKGTKAKMLQMLDKVEQGKEFLRSKSYDRPANVLGDSIVERLDVVRDANRSAASRIEPIAESLKGETLDVQPAVQKFLEGMKKMGVNLSAGEDGILAEFMGSDVEGLSGPMNAINKIVRRMANTKTPDAHDAHRLKKYIDEIVSYGKNAEGLSGNVERLMKELRHNINIHLADEFPAYAKNNKQYAETISAIDALQDVAGKKMDLTGGHADKALGTLMRRMTSNAQSRVPLIYATEELDTLAKKYTSGAGTDVAEFTGVLRDAVPAFDDDIQTMAEFVSELEGLFGSQASTSFMGDIGKAGDRMAETALETIANKPTVLGMLSGAGKGAYRATRGINEKNALKAIRKMLEQ